jgi:type IV pilus assembly protein PilE
VDTVRSRKAAIRPPALPWAEWTTYDSFETREAAMKNARGFTLVEVMVVVVVIGLLAAVAYPSYQDYLRRSHRSAAQQLMLEIASRQEQYMLDARSYTATLGTSAGLNLAPQGWDCTTVATKCSNTNYEITVSAPGGTPPTFAITATAKSAQSSDGNLTLNSGGQKTPTGKW